jgi:hypothetical protein
MNAVKMVRRLTNKETPEVICESSLDYKLPKNLINLMSDASEADDPAIHEYCFVEVTNHLNEVFKGTGFFPERLVDCE